MDHVVKILHNEKEVLIVDYSDSKEPEMLRRLNKAVEMVMAENKPMRILHIFNDRCYATSVFMRKAEEATSVARHLMLKSAMTGLSDVKRMIFKGYATKMNRTINEFRTTEEALDFLTID